VLQNGMIYTQAKVSGQGSLELALENRKKETKDEKWLFFKHLVLTCTLVFKLMNDLDLVRWIICLRL
jgi:hypothetical protein